MRNTLLVLIVTACLSAYPQAWAGLVQYGDADVLNGMGTYPIDPRTGATLEGLAPNVVTFGAPEVNHDFPFTPDAGDFPGTDQIFVGSVQTVMHEGYSGAASRMNGPQVLVLDYGSLVPSGATVLRFTLGIAADDFQFPTFGQPYTASVNGVTNTALTDVLNTIDQSFPQVQFFTIGLELAGLLPTHVLTLSIDQGGDGGDGWAVDFLTVGVTLQPGAVPAPGSLGLLMLGVAMLGAIRLQGCRSTASRSTYAFQS